MWTLIITVGLKLVEYFLNKKAESKATLEAFYEFITIAANDIKSVKLHQYAEQQLKELNEKPWKETE